MSKKKRNLLSTLGSRLTAMVSVCLVLVVTGILAVGMVGAHAFSTNLRERMGFSVIMADSASTDHVKDVLKIWRTAPYVSSYTYVSPPRALERWKTSTGDREDIVALLGENPFRHEFEVNVKLPYASVDSIRAICTRVRVLPGVAEVRMQARMIQTINRFLSQGAIVLAIIAVALLIISVVLINNLVRLTIYARRFTISTMRLVGATSSFIMRPFILASVLNGVIAGGIALIILGALLAYGYSSSPDIALLLPPVRIAWVLGGVFLFGILICAVSATFATSRYVRLDSDSLYK